MKPSRKIAIAGLIIGLGAFGYSQYVFATQIGVVITDSRLLGEAEGGSLHDLELEFDNPSLLILTAGETEFTLTADGQKIGDGTLEPFVLSAIGKTVVDGTFVINSETGYGSAPQIKIDGTTKYNMLFASIDVPFVYYPTEDQARAFIHQN